MGRQGSRRGRGLRNFACLPPAAGPPRGGVHLGFRWLEGPINSRVLTVSYRNDAWGEMRTKWRFTVDDGKVTRFETGQA